MVALAALLVTDDRTPVPGFFDLPVTGGAVTFDMLGLHPEERGMAIALLARGLFNHGGSAAERASSVRRFIVEQSAAPPAADVAAVTIAVPLTADHWRDLLPPPQNRGDLFAGLITNRSVLLVCAGTLATSPSIRTLLERDRGLLRWLVRTAPAAFWIAARSLAIERDRVVVPGGAEAEPLWEGLAGERVTRPADFIRALVSRDGGRLAWFFDAMTAMAPERRAAVFGTGAPAAQADQARALYAAFRSGDANWRVENHPFLRGLTDAWMVTTQVALADGVVAPPAQRWLWDTLFQQQDLNRRAAAAAHARGAEAYPTTLAWLAQQTASVTGRERRDRFEMVRFAQSVYGALAPEDVDEALVALSSYRRYRALLLTLDRMEVRSPRVHARAVEAARRIDGLPGRDRRHAVVVMQAALAVLERARVTRMLDTERAAQLVLALSEVANGDRPAMAITQWMVKDLLDALPPLVAVDQWTGDTAYESRLLQALAGAPPGASAPVVTWEGLDYRVDYFAAEHARIKRVREQLTSPGLDAAIASGDMARIVEALQVLIYAPALGDPEGAALLGGDIPRRHNFGFDGAASIRRDAAVWSVPRELVGGGAPWHVEGSLLGLDLALARLALRRLADNEMPVAPTINLNDQVTFARTTLSLNPHELHDADRDRLVAAIARGRARVAAAATLAEVRALATEVRLAPAVLQTLPWTMTRTPDLAPALFGLRDLLWLGQPGLPAATLDRWGIYAEALEGRLTTRMPDAAPWENFTGRADGGLMATQAPDLILRMAEETARLKLPAQLIPGLMTYAAQDYWHDVESRFSDDWPALARQALALSPDRVEDYVAALAGGGPLQPR